MRFEIFNKESKVHLTLSTECNYCLENDADSFGITKGCLVNKIICNYYRDAKASKEYIKSKNSGNNISWFFNLNKTSRGIITEDCQEQAKIYTDEYEHQVSINPSKYIRALLEEYSSLSYSNREIIIFKDTYDKILGILNNNLKLLLSIENNPQKYIVRPYKLMVDKNYNYLVGFSKTYNSDEKEIVFSSRISRISKIVEITEKNILSKEDIHRINQSIKDKGIAYLVGDIEEITVNLTAEGKKLYKMILQDRPKKIKETTEFNPKKDKFVVQYKFKCTPRQATSYFRRFGSEVEIVEPRHLRNKFIRDLKKSLKIYGEE